MIVISNTSPLLALSRIGKESLLSDLFGSVSVPIAVQVELARRMVDVGRLAWLEVVTDPVFGLDPDLDRGEAEAIALAAQRQADVLLIDEKRGRAVAKALGIPVVGTLGILILAKQEGLVPFVAPLIEELELRSKFWIAPSLRRKVLEAAGENP